MEWNADLYRSKHGFVANYGQSVVALLAPAAGETILDVGCGTGELTQEIADTGATVIGIDASPTMIEAARARHPALEFQVADAAALPFDARFDAVFSNAALHWVREARSAARSMAKALKPGGRFVAEFGGHGNVARLESAFRRALADVAGVDPRSPWFFPTIGEYTSLLEDAGFLVRAAWLVDRPTLLAGRDGLRHWYTMFRPDDVASLPSDVRERVFLAVEAALADRRRDDGWMADYRRLRVTAVLA
ncbi:MAG: methyltransferase domain-containing protein [Burkholderiales bacterium]